MSWYRRFGRLTLRKGLCLVCLERFRGGNRAFMGGFSPRHGPNAIALGDEGWYRDRFLLR